MKHYLLLLLFAVMAYPSDAQDKKAKKYYQSGYKLYAEGRLEESEKWMLKALERDSTLLRAYYVLSDIYDLQKAVKKEENVYLQILNKVDSNDFKAHYNLANLYLKHGHFENAVKKYRFLKEWSLLPQRYNKNVTQELVKAENALSLYNNPVDVTLERLSGNINTSDLEYWPHLSPDGKTLFFTRAAPTPNPITGRNTLVENIHYAKFENGEWTNGQFLSAINSYENDGAPCLTQDGKTLYFTACNRPNYPGDCNIYVSYWKNDTWSLPTLLPPPVNTPYKETQPSISFDGKTLFFSSDRPNGMGGMDIYVAHQNEEGQWSIPRNLGSAVNTPKNEESPFIHADNKTLYFSSNGLPELGNGDLFMIRLGKGNEAINLGYPINNHQKQLGIMVPPKGDYAYFAAADSSSDNLDIYRFKLPAHIRPLPVIQRHILVQSAANNLPLAADIIINSLSNNKQVLQAQCDNKGRHTTALPVDSQYKMFISYINYLPQMVFLNANAEDTIFVKLEKIKTGEEFVLENIYFDFDSVSVKTESLPEIAYLVQFLETNPKVVIEIQGHTDNVGEDSYNLELSLNRALSVKQQIVKINSKLEARIETQGYGRTKPIASNDEEIGRSKNRRTAVKILKEP